MSSIYWRQEAQLECLLARVSLWESRRQAGEVKHEKRLRLRSAQQEERNARLRSLLTTLAKVGLLVLAPSLYTGDNGSVLADVRGIMLPDLTDVLPSQ